MPARRPARDLGWALGLAAGVLCVHAALWTVVCRRRRVGLLELLRFWDAGLYARIASEGYVADTRAFYPLFPWLERGVHRLAGNALPVELAGALLSLCAYAGFVRVVQRLVPAAPAGRFLAPTTRLGWLAMLVSPASWIFETGHTESLFLLLSALSFAYAVRREALRAGLFAALACWTRNQGLLVAACAVWLCVETPVLRLERVRLALRCAVLPVAAVAAFLAYNHLATGDALAFVHAQRFWTRAHDGLDALRTLWLGNPWQVHDGAALVRHAFAVLIALASIALYRQRPALGAYALASLSLMLFKGSFGTAFRFGAVLFPVLFFLGDRVASLRPPLRWGFGAVWASANVFLALALGLHRWAY